LSGTQKEFQNWIVQRFALVIILAIKFPTPDRFFTIFQFLKHPVRWPPVAAPARETLGRCCAIHGKEMPRKLLP